MPRRPANVEALAALAAVFRRRRLRWYVFGAQAVLLHGRPRMTEDIDVTIDLDEKSLPALVTALDRAGFRARVEALGAFVARTRVLPVLHEKTGTPVDIVIAGAGLEQEFLERATLVDTAGVRVPVLAPDDLVITKIIAGRPKDLEDAAGVLEAQGRAIDRARIRRVLRELDRALGQDDFSRRFARLS